MLMKRYKAGSQTNPSAWHASTHDWPCSDDSSRRADRGGHDKKELALEAQLRTLESVRGMNGPLSRAQDVFTGGNGASGEQKSCRFKGQTVKNKRI